MLADLFKHSPIPGVSIVNVPLPRLKWSPPSESRLPIGKQFESQAIAFYNQSPIHTVLAQNAQIIEDGITLGELDLIVRDEQDNQVWHIEMVRKFYRYEESLIQEDHYPWIGPADKDHLSRKCNRLAEHQFPMLYHEATRRLLDKLNLSAQNIKQGLLYKADLFSLESETVVFADEINPQALRGNVIYFDQISSLGKQEEYHICHKQEWLMEPSNEVNWLSYQALIDELSAHHSQLRALIIWRRSNEQTRSCILIPRPKNIAYNC